MTGEALHKELEKVQQEIIAEDPSLGPFAFISSCKSDGITVIGGSGGFRSLGGPIGSDDFKLEYIKETWEKTKRDWEAFKNMHWAVARCRCIRGAAKQHLKLKQCPPYQDLLVCLGEEIRSMGKTSF